MSSIRTDTQPGSTGIVTLERIVREDDRSSVIRHSCPRSLASIVPDDAAVRQRLQPGVALEDLVWDGARSLAVTGSSGATIAESDNYLAIYENAQSSSAAVADGYVYWLWSCARPREAGVLRELWSHVDVTGGGDLMVYDPGGDREENGTIGPHPEKTGGDTDEFAVRWQGDHGAQQVVTGSCSTRRGDDDERGLEWTVHLTAEAR